MKKNLLALPILLLCGCSNATPSDNVDPLIIHETSETEAEEYDLDNFDDNDVLNFFFLITSEDLGEYDETEYKDVTVGYYVSTDDETREDIILKYGEESEVSKLVNNYENNIYSVCLISKGVLSNDEALEVLKNVFPNLNSDNACFARNFYQV